MKKNSLLFIFGFLSLSFCGFSQITVNSTGMVGINNTSPTYQLDVNGDFRTSSNGGELVFNGYELYSPSSSYCILGSYGAMWQELFASQAYFNYNPIILSDLNAKTDIKDLSNVKDKLLLLRPVVYKLKPKYIGNEGADAKIAEMASIEQHGLIAQEVLKIFPEIVSAREDGTLGIRYTNIIPLLVKALQEQQVELDSLKARIERLETDK